MQRKQTVTDLSIREFAVGLQICILFSTANFIICLLRLFRFSLNEESRWIKNMMRKKKLLLLGSVHDYFLLHAPNLNDMLSIFNIWHFNDSSSFVNARSVKHDESKLSEKQQQQQQQQQHLFFSYMRQFTVFDFTRR